MEPRGKFGGSRDWLATLMHLSALWLVAFSRVPELSFTRLTCSSLDLRAGQALGLLLASHKTGERNQVKNDFWSPSAYYSCYTRPNGYIGYPLKTTPPFPCPIFHAVQLHVHIDPQNAHSLPTHE